MTERSLAGKEKDSDADAEMQLLEANKRRLLRQRDWIGTAPSQPVHLQTVSIQEKIRIGKRRKIDGKSKPVALRRSSTTFPHRTREHEGEGHVGANRSGALPMFTTAENVRVRIGSDALTAVASTQLNNDRLSQTKSDSMLFDGKSENVAPRLEAEAPSNNPSFGHVLTPNSGTIRVQPSKSYKDLSPQHDQYAHLGLTACLDSNAGSYTQPDRCEKVRESRYNPEGDEIDPSYHITHHVGGIERPLELVFGRLSPSKATPIASPTDQFGEVQRFHAEPGYAPRNVGEAHQSSVRRPSSPPAIVDEEPWRAYLDTGYSSSGHSCVDDGTGTSVPQPHVPARKTRADRTSWPQHTDKSKLTHVHLLAAFASLPAPKPASGRLPDARPRMRTDAVKHIDEHENLWRSFALGSDPESAIDTIHTHNEAREDLMSRATKGYASTRLSLSDAVTSVSSTPSQFTPFRSLSGQASRISDSVQTAPCSGSRSITSAGPSCAMWGRTESGNEDDMKDKGQVLERTPAGSHFGAQWTHASLQNHASHEDDMFSDTRTSRSDLDRQDRAWDDVSRRAQASGSIIWQRSRNSSIGDITDSDGAGIDLVDVDRLT